MIVSLQNLSAATRIIVTKVASLRAMLRTHLPHSNFENLFTQSKGAVNKLLVSNSVLRILNIADTFALVLCIR